MEALKKRIEETPELANLKNIFEEDTPRNRDTLAMLLDEPKMLDLWVSVSKIFEKYDLNQKQQEIQPAPQMDEDDPQFVQKKASELNAKWFSVNDPITVNLILMYTL